MYGITAVRFEASGAPRIHEVLMGLLAPEARGWDLPPAPVPLIEVIDRLLEGDAIVAPAHLQVQDSLHGGWEESIAFPEESNAPGLQDLPRFELSVWKESHHEPFAHPRARRPHRG